jgi:hypothetical protein
VSHAKLYRRAISSTASMSVIQGEGGVPAWIGELGRRPGLHVAKLGSDSKTSAQQRMATSVVVAAARARGETRRRLMRSEPDRPDVLGVCPCDIYKINTVFFPVLPVLA